MVEYNLCWFHFIESEIASDLLKGMDEFSRFFMSKVLPNHANVHHKVVCAVEYPRICFIVFRVRSWYEDVGAD